MKMCDYEVCNKFLVDFDLPGDGSSFFSRISFFYFETGEMQLTDKKFWSYNISNLWGNDGWKSRK